MLVFKEKGLLSNLYFRLKLRGNIFDTNLKVFNNMSFIRNKTEHLLVILKTQNEQEKDKINV